MRHLWSLLLPPSSLILLVTTSPWSVDAGPQLPRSAVANGDDDIFTPIGNALDPGSLLRARSVLGDCDNATLSEFLLPALRPNAEQAEQESLYDGILRFFHYRNLVPRDFSCPTNSTPCASLNRTDICCGQSETCYIGTDTGCGVVGCCPQGHTCSGPVQCCNTAAGYIACSENTDVGSNNGGCCIPGYTCYGTGCVSTLTSTTVTTAPAVTITTGVPPSSSTSSSSGGSAGARQTGQSSSSSTTSTTSTTSTSTTTTISSTTTSGPGITTITSLNSLCPTNMYFCSAYYRPGCCIVDRECALTNCLFATSTSTFISGKVTIAVPVGGSTGGSEIVFTNFQTTAVSTSFEANGACLAGFQTCPPSLNGGCCPPSFACESGPICSAIAGMGVTGVVSKVAPSLAVRVRMVTAWGYVYLGVGVVMGALMVGL